MSTFNSTLVTDLNNHAANAALSAQGWTVRHIEDWHDHDTTAITWDAPEITNADLPC